MCCHATDGIDVTTMQCLHAVIMLRDRQRQEKQFLQCTRQLGKCKQ